MKLSPADELSGVSFPTLSQLQLLSMKGGRSQHEDLWQMCCRCECMCVCMCVCTCWKRWYLHIIGLWIPVQQIPFIKLNGLEVNSVKVINLDTSVQWCLSNISFKYQTPSRRPWYHLHSDEQLPTLAESCASSMSLLLNLTKKPSWIWNQSLSNISHQVKNWNWSWSSLSRFLFEGLLSESTTFSLFAISESEFYFKKLLGLSLYYMKIMIRFVLIIKDLIEDIQ